MRMDITHYVIRRYSAIAGVSFSFRINLSSSLRSGARVEAPSSAANIYMAMQRP